MMLTDLRAPPRPRRPARRATAPRRRRQLEENQITGTFPPALCYVATCQAAGNPDLVAPCDKTGCCDLGDGTACPAPTPAPKSSQCSQACEAKFLQKCGGSHYWCERNENWRCFDDLYRGHSMFEGQCEIACTPTAAMIQPTCDASCQGTFPAGSDVPDSSRPLCCSQACEAKFLQKCGGSHYWCERNENWRCFDDLYRGHSMFEGQCEIACTPTATMIQPTCDASCQGTFPTGWDVPDSSRPACTNTGSSNNSGTASLAIIIPVVIAAVLLAAAVLFLVRKRVVAARQHRRESMPTVGGDEAEAEA